MKKLSIHLAAFLLVGKMGWAMEGSTAQTEINDEVYSVKEACNLFWEMNELAARNQECACVVIDKGLLSRNPGLAKLVFAHYGRELVTDVTKLDRNELRALVEVLGSLSQYRVRLGCCCECMSSEVDLLDS